MKEYIKVGVCVAYDWDLLKISLPYIYKSSDSICLSLDINRCSWSGKTYSFSNEAFLSFIKEIDVQGKITVYEDDFCLTHLSSLENDTRQRMKMAEKMGKGGWHIQVDSDEYFVQFDLFVNYLKSKSIQKMLSGKEVNICVNVVPIIKQTESGYIYVTYPERNHEVFPMATNKPDYERARRNGYFNFNTKFYIIHQTWARNKEDVWKKINNWGHQNDFVNIESYFNLWKALDEHNFQYLRNLHPIIGGNWPKLDFCKSETINDIVNHIELRKNNIIPFWSLYIKNSRNIQRLIMLYNYIIK